MKPVAAKERATQLDRSRLAHRASGPTLSYPKTRVRGSRLLEAAFILAIAELTRRLHLAYQHAYDKQAAGKVLPQNPGTVTVSYQIAPMEQVDCPDAAAESASVGRRNGVVLNYTDGTREIRQGGSRSWRNDNPGNIRPGNLQGEIGSAGGFAVFNRESAGQSAIVELLSRPAYQALTVFGAINRWAPPVENDTAAYQARVQNLTGLDGQTQMSTLTGGQLQSVANAIRNVEGWTPGRRTCWRQRAQ
jgi:hypothetical protein